MSIPNEAAYRLFVLAGLTRGATRLNRKKILVLGYHDVYAGPSDPVLNFDGLRVHIERFERQMRYLADHYHVVHLNQLLASPVAPDRGRPVAAITFDDGYQGTYRYAFPVLQRFALPAAVFVITDFLLSGRAPWWDRLRAMVAATRRPAVRICLSDSERSLRLATVEDRRAALRLLSFEFRRVHPQPRETLLADLAGRLGVDERGLHTAAPVGARELREMADSGICVGAHGCSHNSFLHLTGEALRGELIESKRALEAVTGRPVEWLAYPYGEFSRQAPAAAREAGYRGALTTIEGLNDGIPDPYLIRRIGVNDTTSLPHFIAAVSGLRDHLKSTLRIGEAERWKAGTFEVGV